MEKINIAEKFELIDDQWNPRIVAELNDQQIRLVKIMGDFPFHEHDNEDEMFLVIKGTLKLEFEDRFAIVNSGEFILVPRGISHRPVAEDEVHLMMFVTNTNRNTGNLTNDLTLDASKLSRI
jgi:mannose-6-phosphate isomerase-like protein (cupin superfamily)